MLSKNNYKERLRKMDEKQDRFSIRKFTIGAASVLIGSVFFAMSGNQAKADTVENQAGNGNGDVDNGTEQTKAVQPEEDSTAGQVQQGASDLQVKKVNNEIKDLKSTQPSPQEAKDKAAKINNKLDNMTPEQKSQVAKANGVKDSEKTTVGSDNGQESHDTFRSVESHATKSSTGLTYLDKIAIKEYQAASDKLDQDAMTLKGQALEDENDQVGRIYDNLSDAAKEAIQNGAIDEAMKNQNPQAGQTYVKTNYKGGFRDAGNTASTDKDKTFALPEKTQQNTAQVSNYKDFSAALVNKNINYIELQGEGLKFDDATVEGDQSSINNGGTGAEGISSRNAIPHYEIALNKAFSSQYDNIGRQLVIEGQGKDKTTLDMGKWYFSFWNSNNKDGNHSWKITLKDLTFKTDAAEYKAPSPRAPFVFNGKSANGSSVNLVNVNADFGKRGAGLVNSNDKVAANIKDSTVTATGTVIKNGQNVVLDGVTANISNGSLVYTSGDLTVKGQNSVTDDLKSKSNDAFIAKNVNIDDNAVLDLNITNSAVGEKDKDIDLAGKNNNVFYIGSKNVKTASLDNPSDNGNFTVGNNAKITLNEANVTKDKDGSITATQKGLHNLRFIYNVNGQGGNFVVNSGAKVDLNMGTGHSVAIQAGNLSIAKDATVNIATLQNNNKNYGVGDSASVTYNGFHWAPVTLGMIDTQIGDIDLKGKNSTDAEINGTLRIIRGQKSQDIDVQSPLIGFGSGSTNEKQTFTLNVNKGATLDLQDSSNTSYDTASASPIAWNKALDWIGTNANVNRLGLITMFGTGATNNITFDSPQYINLQRRGSQIGSALRTEGLHNHIIAKDDATKGTPLAQWMGQNQSETPDEAWRIQNLDTQVAGGNFYSNFLPAGAKAGEKGGQFFDGSGYLKDKYFGTPFDKSQGTAQMAPFMGDYKYENGSYTGDSMAGVHGIGLTQLTNDFTYWAPRRITFGENGVIKINDATNYEPETQAITKTTKDDLKSLTKKDLQDGIKDLRGSDNKVAQDHKAILSDKSLINWDDSSWGLDWSKTDFAKIAHDNSTDFAELQKLNTEVAPILEKQYNDKDDKFKPTKDQQKQIDQYNALAKKLGLTQQNLNVFNALNKIANVTPAIDSSTGKFAKMTNPKGGFTNGRVATIVYKDSTADHPSVDFVLVPINVIDKAAETDADKYDPSYKDSSTKEGTPITINPSFTNNEGKDVVQADVPLAPTNGNKAFSITDNTLANEGITIDDKTGAINVSDKTAKGVYNIPVTVTYTDGSNDKTIAHLIVTDKSGDQTVIWGDKGAVVVTADPNKLGAHETNDNDQPLSPSASITAESYKFDKDGKLPDKGTPMTIDPDTVSWDGTAPSTKIERGTETVDGKDLGNFNIKVDLTNNEVAKDVLGSKNGEHKVAIDIKAKGAHAHDNKASKVRVVEGEALTEPQYKALVDRGFNDDIVKNASWQKAPSASDKNATVRVNFNDGTYLDVAIPAENINFVPSDKATDADKYTPDGGNITRNKGYKLTNQDAEDAINNSNSLPAGTKYVWKDNNGKGPDTSTIGDKTGVVTVTYPDNSSEDVDVLVHVTDDAHKYDPQGKTITINKGDNVPDAKDGIKNPGELPSGTTYTWEVAPNPEKPGNQPTIINVNYPDGSIDKVPTTVIVKDTDPNSGDKKDDASKYDPKPNEISAKKGDDLTNKAPEGIANKDELPQGTKYTWKDDKVPSTDESGDKPVVITVTYPDGSSEDVPTVVHVAATDADKYDPKGQNIVVNPGDTPDPSKGISNKATDPKDPTAPNLPEGTKYTWEKTPDTTTPGDKPGTIVVTYPDGSKDKVPTIVTVKDPKAPKNTDAEKNDPIGTTIVARIGDDLTNKAADGIANKDDLPANTKYAWTGDVPSTDKAGLTLHYVTVHYNDGSEDHVPVYVLVKGDSDNYDPEPKVIEVNPGDKPDPKDGIKNPGDLPDGTKYTWKDGDPDTTTPGDKPVTIVVHYPDGTIDEVPTIVHVKTPVTNPDNGNNGGGEVTPSTPEAVITVTYKDPNGNPIKTVTLTVPEGSDPSQAIKDNVPEGYQVKDESQLPHTATDGAHYNIDVVPVNSNNNGNNGDNTPSDNGDNGDNGDVDNGSSKGHKKGAKKHWNDNFGSGAQNGNGNGSNFGAKGQNGNGNDKNAKTLPETGDKQTNAGIFGLAIAGLAGILGLAGDRKRKNN